MASPALQQAAAGRKVPKTVGFGSVGRAAAGGGQLQTA